ERSGETPKPREEAELESATRLTRMALVAVVLIYLQLIAGAVMRHYEAGLAIPDFPLSYGQVLPPTSAEQLADANARRAFQMQLPPVTQAQVWLHFAHRIGAVFVSVAIIAMVTLALRRFRGRVSWELVNGAYLAAVAGLAALGAAGAIGSRSGWVAGVTMLSLATIAAFILRAFFRRMGDARAILAPAILSAALLLAQVTLGILTVLLRKPADIASAHVAVGALTLVTTFVLTIRAWRLKAVSSSTCTAAGAARASDDEETEAFTREPVLAA
ncbi:MAG: COX15/CtaA family protein, partial [Tepidisphaeraceae bacterium]